MVYTIIVHLYAKADEESISKLKAKLVEASQVYSKDKETLSWFVMQDTVDPRKFSIVERYLKESVRWSLAWVDRSSLSVPVTNEPTVTAIPPEQPLLGTSEPDFGEEANLKPMHG